MLQIDLTSCICILLNCLVRLQVARIARIDMRDKYYGAAFGQTMVAGSGRNVS